MPHCRCRAWILAGLLCAAPVPRARALPPNFVDELYVGGWNLATGLTFGPDGRLYVWEKAGRVWTVTNGVKSATPLIDLSEEVGNWRDFGLLGFVLDPDFQNNGYIYLLYVVDYYYLTQFGTPGYNPAANTYFHDTIGRLTRYTATAASGHNAVDPASRLVLVGESITAGFPICHQSHGVGMLLFGSDGTLLTSCGDGAAYNTTDIGGPVPGSSNTALADGIITPKEDVGANRAQLVDSLSGKIIRIDRTTGDGIPSNPFYDAVAPRAPRSRVWAMGLRNPYRMSLRPGTGAADPAAANPGVIYLGDVGWNTWEDLNVCTAGGQNFGWPIFEGLTVQPNYQSLLVPNKDAPNPLFGTTPPGQPPCVNSFFAFRDLIRQETLEPNPTFPNPCNPAVTIPANIHTFLHRRPAIDWHHGSGPSRTGIFNGNDAAEIALDDPLSPVTGPSFGGNASTGGVWYTGNSFPAQYQNLYFQGDYGARWIRAFRFDAQNHPTEVIDFAPEGEAAVVCFAADPAGSGIYFIDYNEQSGIAVRRIVYTNNEPPAAAAAADPTYGPAPLSVQFSSAGSTDPEGHPLTYDWDFGDGGPHSALANPSHQFVLLDDISTQGSLIGRVFQLNPPQPTGGGNYDPEVMRDGDYPPVGNADGQRQFDTFHNGDQGAFDWVGYSFPQPREFRRIIFQEGMEFFDGGWFDSLQVQVRSGIFWSNVQNLTITPAYAGNNAISYETWYLDFTPVTASEIRIAGNPGGSSNFVSVGELRVLATPAVPIPAPVRRDVTLTVRDPLNNTASASLVVSLNNTPPDVVITSPPDGSYYSLYEPLITPLTAEISDAEHSAGELECAWRVILHHNEHTHPEPPTTQCADSAEISPIGCDGETYFYEAELSVTDGAGLNTTVSSYVYPDCAFRKGDFDQDYDLDASDVISFRGCYSGPGGGPLSTMCGRGDFDLDGDTDCEDWSAFRTAYNSLHGAMPLPALSDFVEMLLSGAPNPADDCIGDIDGNGHVDGDDIAPYVDSLIGG